MTILSPLDIDLSETDKAYAAGLLDGEGTLFIGGGTNKHYVYCAIGSTYLPVLEWLKQNFNGRIVSHKLTNAISKKPMWYWKAGKDVRLFIPLVFPYMKIKKVQAQIVLEFWKHNISSKHLHSKHYGGVPPEVMALREGYRLALKTANGVAI